MFVKDLYWFHRLKVLTMIGNDVIDLQQARLDSNWRRPGFSAKIFTSREQQLISEAQDPEWMVWQLWSMKEAGYKIINRMTRERLFAPLSYECSPRAMEPHETFGTVLHAGLCLYTRTIYSQLCLNTLALTSFEAFSSVYEFFDSQVTKDSLFFTNRALWDLNHGFVKAGGIYPEVIDRQRKCRQASLSHHGSILSLVVLKGNLCGIKL